jgi:hypothetical protein
MQITPTSSLLQALSGSATNPSTGARPTLRPAQTAAGREAARAVFAQLKAPAAGTPGTPTPSTPTSALPTTPSTQPRRPLPRGSIINILV